MQISSKTTNGAGALGGASLTHHFYCVIQTRRYPGNDDSVIWGRGSTNASVLVWALSRWRWTRGVADDWNGTATHQSWLRPLLPSHWFLQKTRCGENEPEVSSPITFQINFCPLILFKVDVSFILAPLKAPVCFQHVFGHLIGKWKKKNLFSFFRPKKRGLLCVGA